MKDRQEFDDLARRKLEAREFAFEEAAWNDMQRVLAGRRRNRGALVWWTISGAALLLVGFLFWRSMSVEPTVHPLLPNEVVTSEPKNEVPTPQIEEKKIAAQEREQMEPKAEEAIPVTESPAALAPVRTAPKETSGEEHVTEHQASPTEPNTAQVALVGTTADQVVPAPVVEPESETLSLVEDAIVPVEEPVKTNAVGSVEAGVIVPVTVAALAVDEVSGSVVTTPAASEAATSGNAGNTSEDAATTVTEEPASDPVIEAPLSEQNDNGENAPAPVVTGADTITATTVSEPAATAAASAPPPPAIIPASSPWEIGVLGGYFTTTSDYSGPRSENWDVTGQQTPAFGAEWMYIGRNFGLGTGLHYGTYADRLITPEEYRTTFVSSSSWFLIPVDTTVLIITGYDPLTGQYTGQSVEMTIHELRMTLDSTYTSVRFREARERINRTSYLDLPLLLDAHLVQGRWSFGVRGGPTVGLLTQRQGSIPSDDAEGYTEFNEVAMRSLTFGWTARAYVRYRFNSAWSVGIEPAARGQLVDGLHDQGVTRRSNAIGGMISLSYRLP